MHLAGNLPLYDDVQYGEVALHFAAGSLCARVDVGAFPRVTPNVPICCQVLSEDTYSRQCVYQDATPRYVARSRMRRTHIVEIQDLEQMNA
jgi:hypothetical protein